LNNLLSIHLKVCQTLTLPTKVVLAETLGMLYYFKHSQVLGIFASSNKDFQTSKSAFTHGVFKLGSSETLAAYLKLLLQRADQIEATDDIDFGSVLMLKKSSKVVQFSEESH
jgi:hypothetical protein